MSKPKPVFELKLRFLKYGLLSVLNSVSLSISKVKPRVKDKHTIAYHITFFPQRSAHPKCWFYPTFDFTFGFGFTFVFTFTSVLLLLQVPHKVILSQFCRWKPVSLPLHKAPSFLIAVSLSVSLSISVSLSVCSQGSIVSIYHHNTHL